MESYPTILNIKGKKPLATWYADNKGHARYRNLTNGRFISEESALEILAKQVTN